jgi:hypothetical protein
MTVTSGHEGSGAEADASGQGTDGADSGDYGDVDGGQSGPDHSYKGADAADDLQSARVAGGGADAGGGRAPVHGVALNLVEGDNDLLLADGVARAVDAEGNDGLLSGQDLKPLQLTLLEATVKRRHPQRGPQGSQ